MCAFRHTTDAVRRTRDAADKVDALTPQMLRTLRDFASGKTAHEIADERGCDERTVKAQLQRAFDRLGIESRKVAHAAYLLGRWEERHDGVIRG